ncbi:hypothetical protein QT986_02910 [Microcoleus sp. herbarium14]
MNTGRAIAMIDYKTGDRPSELLEGRSSFFYRRWTLINADVRRAIAQGLMETTSPASLMRIAEPAGSDDIIVLTCLIKGTRWSGLVLLESKTTILITQLARFC